MAGKGLASWIGDAERGRKELKQGWRDSVVRFDWLGAPRIWTSAGVVGTWKDACLICVGLLNKCCLVASCISPSVCSVMSVEGASG